MAQTTSSTTASATVSGPAYGVGGHTFAPNTTPPHQWTVGGAHTHTINPNVAPNSNPHVFAGGNWAINTPQAPTEGMEVTIKDKLYRFSEATDSWHEVIDATEEERRSAPAIKVDFDGATMLAALQSYEAFLNDLLDTNVDDSTRKAIYDTLFGLEQSIEALEKLAG